MRNRRMIRLLRRYLDGTGRLEDRARVDKWYDGFAEAGAASPEGEAWPDHIKEGLYQRIRGATAGTGRVVPLYRRTGVRVVAAACVLVVVTGAWWLLQRPKPAAVAPAVAVVHDVAAPAKTLATITLGDGRQIALDSAASGVLARQGSTQIQKLSNGRLEYVSGKTPNEITYNTITVPRGSRIVDLTLADGTRVWLNSASSLRYPTVFSGPQRTVELSGEGYFEAADDAVHPFIVKRDSLAVRVLGTKFNVNAYTDEPVIRVTLLEGAVRVSLKEQQRLLRVGEQAVAAVSTIKVARDIDLEAVMAWKNGQFQFGDGAEIAGVMRQIARWYDVDVEYVSPVSGHIGGAIARTVNVSQVLRMLELTGAVRFRVEGRKVVVLAR